MWTLVPLLLSCATLPLQGGRTVPEPVVQTFDLTLAADFETRGADGLELELAPQSLQLEGRVSIAPSVSYRDGSLGRVLRFEELVDGSTGEPHGLEGRAIELRGFESGEVLTIHGMEHLAGPGRHGDVLDVIVPLFSPKVPELQRRDRVVTSTSYPVTIGDTRSHRVSLVTAWTPGTETRRSQVLHYEGQLQCDGEDEGLRVTCAGTLNGELFGSRAGGLDRSTVVMSRTMVLHGPGGSVVQEQRFDATATRRAEPGL